MMQTFGVKAGSIAVAFAAALCVGCKVETTTPAGGGGGTSAGGSGTTSQGGGELSGTVEIDGSSTVFPISAAIGEEFMRETGAQVNVAQSGTGGGFKKFVRGETDISDASRPIKDSEDAQAKEAGIEYVPLKVAIDGISVVVHPDNPIDAISTEQLKQIFAADSTVKKWSDVDPSWPAEEITLYGPDSNSGTFDYFNEEILGDDASPRTDGYKPSEDDNVLVTGVSGDTFALGYFGYSYYVNNKDRLKALAISTGESKAVAPTPENIESGKYTPLARPLFLYVNKAKVAESPTLQAYLQYYVSDEGQTIIEEEDFVRLSAEALDETRSQVAELVGQ